MWDNFIMYALEKMNYGTKNKSVQIKNKYYKISNPFVKDLSPSCVVYKKSGIMRLYNADVNGKNKLEVWEWSKLLGFWNEYVDYLCQHYEMSIGEFMQNDKLKSRYHVYKIKNHEQVEFVSNKLSKLPSRPVTSCHEVKLSDFEREKALEYIESLNLSEEDGIRPCRLRIFSDDYEVFKTGICFDYLYSDFKKYRFLTDEKKYRFRADGNYDKYYTVRKKYTNKCFVVEAEKEAIIVSKFISDDCYGISGTSIPNCDMLKDYLEIEVLLDYDKFYERSFSIYESIKKQNPYANILIRPKLNICYKGKFDNTMDFGDFHKLKKLNSGIVKTGMLKKSDIDNKNNLKYFDFILDTNNQI